MLQYWQLVKSQVSICGNNVAASCICSCAALCSVVSTGIEFEHLCVDVNYARMQLENTAQSATRFDQVLNKGLEQTLSSFACVRNDDVQFSAMSMPRFTLEEAAFNTAAAFCSKPCHDMPARNTHLLSITMKYP
jgi:hypothetical protein